MVSNVGLILVVILYTSHVKSNIIVSENDLVGIYPPVFSPYYENGTINFEIIPSYAKFLSDNGIPGVLVCGTNGEGSLITMEERMLLSDVWMAAGKQYNLQVMLQIAGLPFPEALKLAKYAEETGVNSILALPEQYYQPVKVGELVYYMKLLADQAPNTPILYYDYPGLTRVSLNMVDFFTNATCLIPSFAGLKTDLNTALQIIANTQLQSYQRLFVRTNLELASGFELNLYEAISVFCNHFPKLCTEIVAAVKSGSLSKARELQLEFNRRVGAVTYISDDKIEFVGRSKAAMGMVTGIQLGDLREPLTQLISDETKTSIAQNLMDAGVEIAETSKYYGGN